MYAILRHIIIIPHYLGKLVNKTKNNNNINNDNMMRREVIQ